MAITSCCLLLSVEHWAGWVRLQKSGSGGLCHSVPSSRHQPSHTSVNYLPFSSLEEAPMEQDVPLNWSEKMDNDVQYSWVCQKCFIYQMTQLSWAERPLAERNYGARNLGSFCCAYQAVAKTKVAVLTCEKLSDERLLANRPNSEEE